MSVTPSSGVAVWGGIECSVNRLHDRYHNQLDLGGHGARVDDLDRIAALGIRTVRYPLLWELTAPDRNLANADWRWTDERLGRLRDLGIEPVAGLVHHGSGPAHTSLLDDGFATGLAAYAGAVAARYPWIARYTPVNEPLTTARFSALYGLWYPHARSGPSFVRALLVQCRATVLAMRAIRRIRPDAQLVQTEDLGRVFSTPLLAYQAAFENERRWLTWDLLCGRVDRRHALWRYLRQCGVSRRDIEWFRTNACPPAVIGVNHYVTSNRYLHDQASLFPSAARGGNGKHTYADVEAVRVLEEDAPSWGELLDETWDRYRLPIAITEVHLGCTRDEQMRWLYQAWTAASAARTRGVDLLAITPWALFGSHDWSSLLTRFAGAYEPGAWDVRAATPRRTALADLIEKLARGAALPAESWLRLPGWWQRDTRLHGIPCGLRSVPATGAEITPQRRSVASSSASRTVLITGATGTLGRAFARACAQRGLPYRTLTRGDMDICDEASVAAQLEGDPPLVLINTAGYVQVDKAEIDRERCARENLDGVRVLADVCAARGVPLATFSSDLVFDGSASRPYTEDAVTSPLCVYGATKARAESIVLERHPDALVIRTSAFFGPWDEHNFLTVTLRALARGEPVAAADDVLISPTYVPDLTHATLDLLLDGESGLWHLANRGQTSWYDFALEAARETGVSASGLLRIHSSKLGWRAPRPVFSVLGSSRGDLMPTLATALARYARENETLGLFRAAA